MKFSGLAGLIIATGFCTLASAQQSESIFSHFSQPSEATYAASLALREPPQNPSFFNPRYLLWSAGKAQQSHDPQSREFELFAVDANGNLLQTARLNVGALSHKATRIIPTSDGGFAMTGHVVWPNGGVGEISSVLIKLNSGLQFQWASLIEQNNWLSYYHAFDLKELAGGDLLIVGSTTNTGTQWSQHQFCVTRFSPAGAMQWSRKFGKDDQINKAYSVVESNNKDLYVAGTSQRSTGERQMTVLKLSSTGQHFWSYSYAVNGITGGHGAWIARKSPTTNLEEFYVAGDLEYPGQSFGQRDIHLISIDETGQLLSSDIYGTTGDESARHFVVTPKTTNNQDDVYLTGFTDGVGAGQDDAFILNTLGDGTLRRFLTFGQNRDDSGWELQLEKKRLLMIGRSQRNNRLFGYLVSNPLNVAFRPNCGQVIQVKHRPLSVQVNNLKFDQSALPTIVNSISGWMIVPGNFQTVCGRLR